MLMPTSRVKAWLRDRFFLAIRDIPRVRDYVLQMKFQPMPRFSRGVVLPAGDAALDGFVGRMFIQPRVDVARGQVQRLEPVADHRPEQGSRNREHEIAPQQSGHAVRGFKPQGIQGTHSTSFQGIPRPKRGRGQ